MIRSEVAHLLIAAQTHPGMSGKNNEDRYAVSAYHLGPKDATPAVLAVLCDGIGGHRAGEVAAEIAVDAISHYVSESDASLPVQTLQDAIVTASGQIYAHSQADVERQGMGATCACAWVIADRLYSATVGDSRIYLVRDNRIQQLSTDHTWIQEALESGALRPEEVRGHPNAHVIRRFLGSPNPPNVDFRLRLTEAESTTQAEANQGLRLFPGDKILLCSDGLTDLVTNAEILTTLDTQPPQTAVDSLVDQANNRGGHDNITVVLLGVPAKGRMGITQPLGKTRRRWPWIALGCAGLVVIGLSMGFLLFSLGVLAVNPFANGTPTATPTLPPVMQTVMPGSQPAIPSLMPVEPTRAPGAVPRPTATTGLFDTPDSYPPATSP